MRVSQARAGGEPAWSGGRIDGLLRIWAEQGVGDQVLFASLLALARARAPRVHLECDRRLAPLFRRSFPWLEDIIAAGAPAAAAQAQCSLGGLGAALSVSPDELSGAPYLIADPAQRAATRARYEALAQGRPIIGISWFSENPEFGRYKSSALEEWEPLLRREALFINLQYHSKPEDIAAVQTRFGCTIHTDPDVNQTLDLDAFAAQIAAVDEMISVSNSGVHMAGALGARCTMLAPPGRGLLWYWGMEGETTPWYASLRIVRRAPGQAWTASIAQIADRLAPR